MLSVLRTASPQQPLAESKTKFRTVLGLGGFQKDSEHRSRQQRTLATTHGHLHPPFARRSVDSVNSYKPKRKNTGEYPTSVDVPFFEEDAVTVTKPVPATDDMRNADATQSMPRRRGPGVAGQDGPWTISAAETPHDPGSYSLYVKTPTHNLTLTRTALEIVEMHAKLRDSHPGLSLPHFPIDPSTLPAPPPKRKSAFLNTLSRLASPSSNKTASPRHASGTRSPPSTSSSQPPNGRPSAVSSPVASPSHEPNDPFSSFASSANGAASDAQPRTALPSNNTNNSTVTALAAFLTTISNDQTIRQARVWKRFVRVRTDDLQSVRVERAIKRVRSDLAAHGSPAEVQRSVSQVLGDAGDEEPGSVDDTAEAVDDHGSTVEGPSGPVKEDKGLPGVDAPAVDGPSEQTDRDAASLSAPPAKQPAEALAPLDTTVGELPTPVDVDTDSVNELEPSTPTSHAASRIPRSQSADPTSRASRILSPLSPLRDAISSETSVTTSATTTTTTTTGGDDSSISTTGGRGSARKKQRSKSTDPHASLQTQKKSQRKVVIDDFEMMRVLGKGCAGKVLLVRHKPTSDVFALKAITKRHVLAHQELQHTLTEQAVLKRMAAESSDPFVVKLWFSFHDKENLFLVMDFHPGGDLATQLARWGRLGRDRARFYAAEIVEGVEGLHAAGVIYRDLKPENILIGADGHIVLTDFGLSKEFPRRTSATTAPSTPSGTRGEFALNGDGSSSPSPTGVVPPWMKGGEKGEKGGEVAWGGAHDTTSTFCGTAEYLAPEVIQGLPYSYEVDWWSFGTMLFEMLTGITPFWAENHSDMYFRVLQDELQFPEDRAVDQDTKSLIRGLLQRNPALRMKEPRIKKHPYFSMIDWSHVYYKRYIPPYIPPIDPSNASDTQNFDDTFLDMEPVINDGGDENEQSDTDQDRQTDTDRTDGEDSVPTPSQSRSPSVHPEDDAVFDGYSFKGRHSIIVDDDDDEADGDESAEEDEDESASPSLDDLVPEATPADVVTPATPSEITTVEELPEPKTPEARPSALLNGGAAADVTPVESKPAAVIPESRLGPEPPVTPPKDVRPPLAAVVHHKAESKPLPDIVDRAPVPRSNAGRTQRSRREKSGIPALDRVLAGEDDEAATEREEDDDWDMVETDVNEERNGAKGNSLFARGVVDRYRLAVFRKSTPRRQIPRSASGMSGMSMESDLVDPSYSPTPSDKHQRRGRAPGLNFRKSPKQYLAKSPPGSLQTSSSVKTVTASASTTLSASTASSGGLLTPSPSMGSTLPMTPSLKSKESAASVGSPSESSDQSLNGDARPLGAEVLLKGAGAALAPEEEKQKSKGLKKYKEGAEKVLSIFQSPR